MGESVSMNERAMKGLVLTSWLTRVSKVFSVNVVESTLEHDESVRGLARRHSGNHRPVLKWSGNSVIDEIVCPLVIFYYLHHLSGGQHCILLGETSIASNGILNNSNGGSVALFLSVHRSISLRVCLSMGNCLSFSANTQQPQDHSHTTLSLFFGSGHKLNIHIRHRQKCFLPLLNVSAMHLFLAVYENHRCN